MEPGGVVVAWHGAEEKSEEGGENEGRADHTDETNAPAMEEETPAPDVGCFSIHRWRRRDRAAAKG